MKCKQIEGLECIFPRCNAAPALSGTTECHRERSMEVVDEMMKEAKKQWFPDEENENE